MATLCILTRCPISRWPVIVSIVRPSGDTYFCAHRENCKCGNSAKMTGSIYGPKGPHLRSGPLAALRAAWRRCAAPGRACGARFCIATNTEKLPIFR